MLSGGPSWGVLDKSIARRVHVLKQNSKHNVSSFVSRRKRRRQRIVRRNVLFATIAGAGVAVAAGVGRSVKRRDSR